MRFLPGIVLMACVLTGCSDPLDAVPKIDDVDISSGAAPPQALPSQEVATGGGFLSKLFPAAAETLQQEQSAASGADIGTRGDARVSKVATSPAKRLASNEKPRSGPDAKDVTYGAVVDFGDVARVCDARGKPMGKRIERSSSGKYALYDSAPNSTKPRTFYLTGFSDRCPRQFTASLALLGTPSMHEQLRYGGPGKAFPYSATDDAYEKAKVLNCGNGARNPCGPGIRRMDRSTVFVSSYERFGGNARWSEMLVHNGKMLAVSMKSAR